MPSTKSYQQLHEQVAARPGAALRLAALRKQTLVEMKLFKLSGGLLHRLAAANAWKRHDDRG